MGYGAGALLLAVGLVLALAVQDGIEGVELTTVGWIMAAVGLLIIALTAITLNRTGRARSVATTTHADGSQTVRDQRTEG